MNIYILLESQAELFLKVLKSRILLNNKSFKVHVIKELNNLSIEKDIIIGLQVTDQYNIFKKYTNNYNIYSHILDDKIGFYEFYLKRHPDLLTEISLIPSYDKTYKGENIYSKFMIKHRQGHTSQYNTIESDFINNLINKHNDNYQIQKLLDVKHIYGVDCSCSNGKILGVFTYLVNGILTADIFNNPINQKETNFIKNEIVKRFVTNIIKKLNYNGFIEFEFLIDTNNKIYIMECNPRISGALHCWYYFDWIVMPYLNNLIHKNASEIYSPKEFIERDGEYPTLIQKENNAKTLEDSLNT